MHFLLSLVVVPGIFLAVSMPQDKADGCPKQMRTSPSLNRPKNCPDPKNVPPTKGSLKDNECLVGGIIGGDFFNACYAPDMMSALSSLRSGGKDGGGVGRAKQDWTGGLGPFNARYFTDPSLPNHTIYAPKTPVQGKKLPLIVWGEGACGTDGSGFTNFLTEIASHGFMIIASGSPKHQWGANIPNYSNTLMGSTEGEKSRAIQMTQGIDWAENGAADGKFGEVDIQRTGAAGQSCGGVEAYSASVYDPRVKVIGIYNTGVIDPGRRWYLKELKQRIGYFHGGQTDFAYTYIEQDFREIPENLPAIKAQLQTGHMGTYFEPQGGKFGKASVAFWKWQLQGDQESKGKFFNHSSSLYRDGWQIDTSHWRE